MPLATVAWYGMLQEHRPWAIRHFVKNRSGSQLINELNRFPIAMNELIHYNLTASYKSHTINFWNVHAVGPCTLLLARSMYNEPVIAEY
jgi:hypothetical protein